MHFEESICKEVVVAKFEVVCQYSYASLNDGDTF